MTGRVLLASPLGFVIGLSLGTLGGGGSILAVPALVFVAGQTPADATTTSLLVVGVASIVGAVGHWRHGRVRLGQGVLFGSLGVAGSLGGSALNRRLDGDMLLLAFAALILVAAWRIVAGCPSCTRVGEANSLTASPSRTAVGCRRGGPGPDPPRHGRPCSPTRRGRQLRRLPHRTFRRRWRFRDRPHSRPCPALLDATGDRHLPGRHRCQCHHGLRRSPRRLHRLVDHVAVHGGGCRRRWSRHPYRRPHRPPDDAALVRGSARGRRPLHRRPGSVRLRGPTRHQSSETSARVRGAPPLRWSLSLTWLQLRSSRYSTVDRSELGGGEVELVPHPLHLGLSALPRRSSGSYRSKENDTGPLPARIGEQEPS